MSHRCLQLESVLLHNAGNQHADGYGGEGTANQVVGVTPIGDAKPVVGDGGASLFVCFLLRPAWLELKLYVSSVCSRSLNC